MALTEFNPEVDSLFNDVLVLPEHEKAAFFDSEAFDKTQVYECFNPGMEFKTTYRKKHKKIPSGPFTVSIEFAVWLLTKFSDHNRRFDKTNRFKTEKNAEPDKLGRRVYDPKAMDESKPDAAPTQTKKADLKAQLDAVGIPYGLMDGKATLKELLARFDALKEKLKAANIEFDENLTYPVAKELEATLEK